MLDVSDSNEVQAVEAYKFKDEKYLIIHQKLSKLGDGPAAFYRDACRVIENPDEFATASNTLGHYLREIDSSVREALSPHSETASPSDSEDTRRHQIYAIVDALGIDRDNEAIKYWAGSKFHRLAHRRGLQIPRGFGQEMKTTWQKFNESLLLVLQKSDSRFLDIIYVIDTTLSRPASRELARHLLGKLPQNLVTHRYICDSVPDTTWLISLWKEGFFDHPPEPQPADGGVTIPFWPQAHLLIRFSDVDPALVKNIVAKLPRTTNPRIHGVLVPAIASMPRELILDLLPTLENWISHTDDTWFPRDFAPVINRLLADHRPNEAIRLLKQLLAIRSDGETLRTKIDDWHYRKLIEDTKENVIANAPLEAYKALLEVLESATEEIIGEDFNEKWPAAIEDHDQNQTHEYQSASLVYAIRDLGMAILPGHAEEVFGELKKRKHLIFRRLELYLRSQFPDLDVTGNEALLSPEILENHELHHERFHFLMSAFRFMQSDAKDVYLAHVENIPNEHVISERLTNFFGREPTDDEIERKQSRPIFDRLVPIREQLEGEWKTKFEVLSQRFKISDHPDFLVYFGTAEFVNYESPKSNAELRKMSLDDLFLFLKNYEPSGSLFDHSLEGLQHELAALIRESPREYLVEAERFKGLNPDIIDGVFTTVEVLIKDGKMEPSYWAPVLDLAQWVVSRPHDEPVRKGSYIDINPGWKWTRKRIARALEEGVRTDSISFNLRQTVWNLIAALTSDPDPNDETQFGETSPMDISLNTVRGGAFRAMHQYSLWVRRQNEPKEGNKGNKTFQEVPEVREVLEKHLEIAVEPRLSIRALYGEFFPWIVLLDRDWAIKNKEKIFPRSPDLRRYFSAAWSTYVTFNRPYREVLEVLKEEIAFAIEVAEELDSALFRDQHPSEYLIKHILVYYWWGLLSLDSQIIIRFFEAATPEMRASAIEFIGSNLRVGKVEVPSDELRRLEELWNWRRKIVGSSQSNAQELIPFGAWFASGRFEDKWSFEQLTQVLELTSWAEPDHSVVARVAELAAEYPAESIHCLRKMIEGDKNGWAIDSWRENPRKILAKVLEKGDENEREEAVKLINFLASQGRLDYRNLL